MSAASWHRSPPLPTACAPSPSPTSRRRSRPGNRRPCPRRRAARRTGRGCRHRPRRDPQRGPRRARADLRLALPRRGDPARERLTTGLFHLGQNTSAGGVPPPRPAPARRVAHPDIPWQRAPRRAPQGLDEGRPRIGAPRRGETRLRLHGGAQGVYAWCTGVHPDFSSPSSRGSRAPHGCPTP